MLQETCRCLTRLPTRKHSASHGLHIPFEDPAGLSGTHEEKMATLRVIRDKIRTAVQEFIDWANASGVTKLGDLWEFKPTRD